MARSRGWRETLGGFETFESPGASGLARPEALAWVRCVLEGGGTLHDAAASDRGRLIMDGRKPVFVIPAKVSGGAGPPGKWVVRRFARGGRILPALLGDRYLRSAKPRPFHEAKVSEWARTRGIPTPKVVAAAVHTRGLIYRGDLVTELVPSAVDLVEALFDDRRKGTGGAVERWDALKAAGNLVSLLGRAGLRHGDLHAGNVLLRWEGASPTAVVLDLGRARFLPEGSDALAAAMARRLKRSLRKWETRTGLRLSAGEWRALEMAAMG